MGKRQQHDLEITALFRDKMGTEIGFAIDPSTGLSYYINAAFRERFGFTEERDIGTTFKAWCDELDEDGIAADPGKENGRVVHVDPRSIIRMEAPIAENVIDGDEFDEIMDSLQGKLDAIRMANARLAEVLKSATATLGEATAAVNAAAAEIAEDHD
jgi:hypothetical protein